MIQSNLKVKFQRTVENFLNDSASKLVMQFSLDLILILLYWS